MHRQPPPVTTAARDARAARASTSAGRGAQDAQREAREAQREAQRRQQPAAQGATSSGMPLTEYENERLRNVARNEAMLEQLGLAR